MDRPKKLLIDIEGKNQAAAYYSDENVEVVLAGKNIVPVPKNEQNLKIYKLLKDNCDMIFCTTQNLEEFHFYPVPCFWIFAVDSEGNCFGTIGDMGNMSDDDYPVGYVNHQGMYGKIANNLKDFFELITFYPYWRHIIRYEQMEKPYDMKTISLKNVKNEPQYLVNQREIAKILKLTKNPSSIDLLISNIRSTSEFIVYSSKTEAQMKNTFFDIDCFPE
ncbi:hypothetical protein [Natronincola ferrireducens]|uniref:Uncharacterized protein n=1 Tax=Natronincola ferrireducens TaxID=393762 RepID=A0A1G9GZX4_9FIRM|nr:hypothetical protein [Natronincola ferrireducens]SDL06216.1 hypothetical protein SAMN05660472_02542 [Natronincola ferrireducens]